MKKLVPSTILYSYSHQLIYIAIILFSLVLMFSTFHTSQDQIKIDSKLWSDFGAHIPLIRSFSYGQNLPPEYPTFPGEPIRYHFLFYFVVGMMEKVGINLGLALNLFSAIGFSLLLIMIFKISLMLFKKTSVGILAILLFLFNGSLSYILYFQEHPFSIHSFKQIITNSQFASFGPWDGNIVSAFWNLNIYTNQRHLALGFGLSLLIIWIYLRTLLSNSKPKKKHLLITAIIMIILPLLHQASFFITLSTIFFLTVLNVKTIKTLYLYPLLVALVSIPGMIYLVNRQGSLVQFQTGFLAESATVFGRFEYWFYNLGLYLFLIPIVFYLSSRFQKKVFLAVFPLFITANLLRLSPDMINNHKLINFFMIFVVILTAGQLINIWRQKKYLRPIIIILLILLTFSGLIDIFPIFNDHHLTLDDINKNQTTLWITSNTASNSVFLTSTYLYNPASLAGRKTYLDYGYFNWSLGYDDSERKQLLSSLFSPVISHESVCDLLLQNQIDFVLIDSGPGEITQIDPHESTIATQFTPVFSDPGSYDIYHVQQNCVE